MIGYIGGKSYLAPWIIENFPQGYQRKTYCEVFGGGGWILYRKEPSYVEVYNDLNGELVNLFKVIRDNYQEFEHRMQWVLHSRQMYEEAHKAFNDPNELTEIERAMHYAIKRVQGFSGSNSVSFGYCVSPVRAYGGKWLPFLKRLDLINARLKKVQIENQDFEQVINRYDSPDTLFYLDPPYLGKEKYYKAPGVDFLTVDHMRLKECLTGIKGQFSLSYYDHPVIRELYKGYRILDKNSVKHSAGAVLDKRKGYKKPKSVELLIMNY